MSKAFWNSWPAQLKIIYWILLLIALSGIIFSAYTYFADYELTIDWRKAAYFQQIPLFLDQFTSGPFTLSVQADNLLILQNFEASPLKVNMLFTKIFLATSLTGCIILLTVASYLPKFWFYAAMGIWIIILSAVRLEMLRFSGVSGYLPLIIVGGLTVLTAFYFNSFNSKVSFLRRLLSFIILFAIAAFIIYKFSEQQYPFLFIASNALIPMLLITIVFTFIVAHEIIASFIYIITSTSGPESKNHVHFLVITLVYLLNLVILFLHHIEMVDWNFWYFNPYLLLVISALLGIWGFRKREQQYQHLLSFSPLGGYLYLSLAIITFGTVGFFMGSANDPALEVIESGIIYGHLGYGIIFLLYILANFSGPLSRGLNINNILYKPVQMPYFIFRFAGLIATFAFVIIGNWQVPFNYTFGAYFNQQGDFAKFSNQSLLQQGYYQQGQIFAYKNHHANYSLANYYEEHKERGKASAYYINVVKRTPSPYAYVNLASIYNNNNRFFDALFSLQEGAVRMESGPLYNNLALLYSKTEIIDSAIYYLEKASKFNDSEAAAIANIEALAAVHDLSIYMDSLELSQSPSDILTVNNRVVRFNQQQQFFGPAPEYIFTADTSNFYAAGLTYNYLLNTVFNKDTANIQGLINYSDKYHGNIYHEKIRYAQSASEYYHHGIQGSFRRLNALANETYTQAPQFYTTLGQWALEQAAPDQAARFFRLAKINGGKEAVWLEALSLLMLQKSDSALKILNQNPQDTLQGMVVRQMATADRNGTDKDKLFFIKFHLPLYDTVTFENILKSIKNENIKAEAIMDFSKRFFDQDQLNEAVKIYSLMADLRVSTQYLYNDILKYELKLMAAQGNIRSIAAQINNQDINFSFEEFPQKVFYTGLMNAASGNTEDALHNFRWLAANQPFMEMELVMATDYIKSYSDDQFEAYDLLLNALELNPASVRLLKGYALEAARLNLENYANNALEDLQKIILPMHYEGFLERFKAIEEEKEEG